MGKISGVHGKNGIKSFQKDEKVVKKTLSGLQRISPSEKNPKLLSTSSHSSKIALELNELKFNGAENEIVGMIK